jgi:septum formation protein
MRLQGRTHEVWTGIAVLHRGERRTAAECTQVQLARLDEPTLRQYVRTGEPLDKAGAYAIQGLASQFVRRVVGDYANVVGLPLRRLREMLAEYS